MLKRDIPPNKAKLALKVFKNFRVGTNIRIKLKSFLY